VAAAQAAFTKGVGATIEQDPSLRIHPLFGLFAEPASTMLIAGPAKHAAHERSPGLNFFAVRIGNTGLASNLGDGHFSRVIDELAYPGPLGSHAQLQALHAQRLFRDTGQQPD
jgi:phosphoribosylformylglycinamidine synthase